MKLNALEFALMNNPVRAWSQRVLETPVLIGRPGALRGQRVLEVGCGCGVGVEILLEQLQAAEVVAFDLDPEMVALAGKRVARFGDRAHVFVGDAERIDAPDASFDVVVDYGILHHVPNWRGALGEIARVLRPGGTFYFEEVLRGFTGAPLVRDLLDHPQDSQFTGAEFQEALASVGLQPGEDWRRLGGLAVLPCYCGCGLTSGHRSNLGCFIAGVDRSGAVVFDDHGSYCQTCVDIARDARKLSGEGKTLPEIRAAVDERHSGKGPGTDTPKPAPDASPKGAGSREAAPDAFYPGSLGTRPVPLPGPCRPA